MIWKSRILIPSSHPKENVSAFLEKRRTHVESHDVVAFVISFFKFILILIKLLFLFSWSASVSASCFLLLLAPAAACQIPLLTTWTNTDFLGFNWAGRLAVVFLWFKSHWYCFIALLLLLLLLLSLLKCWDSFACRDMSVISGLDLKTSGFSMIFAERVWTANWRSHLEPPPSTPSTPSTQHIKWSGSWSSH